MCVCGCVLVLVGLILGGKNNSKRIYIHFTKVKLRGENKKHKFSKTETEERAL